MLLKDINPGPQFGFPFFSNSFVINNRFIFPAITENEGWELWSSDGTAANTSLFKDIYDGPDASNSFALLNYSNITNGDSYHSNLLNGQMFLRAEDEEHGLELWKTDGTSGGTVMVKDINAGPGSSLDGSFSYFYTASHLFFTADDGTTGNELWKTDGTAGNTARVKDINPGTESSDPQFLAYLNGTVLFTATDGDDADRRDLYRLDGSFSPLPLHLLKFTATDLTASVQLDWSTVSEKGTSHFAIERSSDGAKFETIGNVNAATNGTQKNDYRFNDASSASLQGKLYYRLKMVDKDGSFTYSKIVSLTRGQKVNLVAFPNPAKNDLQVTVNTGAEKQMALKIFDQSGKQVYVQQLAGNTGSNKYTLNVSSFAKGTYYVNVLTETGMATTRFIKN